MKTCIKNLFSLPALIAALGLIPVGRLTAQMFTTMHIFTGDSDGVGPHAGLILSGNTLYGTAAGGGMAHEVGGLGNGTVFAVNTDGTGFRILHSFTPNPDPLGYNSDGAHPYPGLILSGSTLYGTAQSGGSAGKGTVFVVSTNGTGFTNLYTFTSGSDGAYPNTLILSANTLYGTAMQGGDLGHGTVFALKTNGTAFTTLHTFTARFHSSSGDYTNSDGADPRGKLILSGNTLYGTTSGGGHSGKGSVFALNTDGTGFTNLHIFGPTDLFPDSDGAFPTAGLILSGNTLYGTATGGGTSGNGTVFALNTDGTGFTNLHSFTADYPTTTNSDGSGPVAELILSGNTLYGTAAWGGSSANGTVFALNTDGTGFTILHSFAATPGYPFPPINRAGATPNGALILSSNTLYGTASEGGSSGYGTVFSLSFAPKLTINPSGANVILTWPTNYAGFDYTGFTLQSITYLVSPAVWSTNFPPPIAIGGQNIVTNPITARQQLFRLIQ